MQGRREKEVVSLSPTSVDVPLFFQQTFRAIKTLKSRNKK